MSDPKAPEPVKLVTSLFSPETDLLNKVIAELSSVFGQTDLVSHELLFDRTRYYEREMGWPLYRRFASFGELIPADRLVEVKLKTNDMERTYLAEGKRKVNIDPGFLSHERFILATGKNYIHRVYLSKGIYADLTFIYGRGSFRPLEWTYPDYRESDIVLFFNGIRDIYTEQIKELKKLD